MQIRYFIFNGRKLFLFKAYRYNDRLTSLQNVDTNIIKKK